MALQGHRASERFLIFSFMIHQPYIVVEMGRVRHGKSSEIVRGPLVEGSRGEASGKFGIFGLKW